MINQTISHYHIVEKLGGGMGVVCKGEDLSLGRQTEKNIVDDSHPEPRFSTAGLFHRGSGSTFTASC